MGSNSARVPWPYALWMTEKSAQTAAALPRWLLRAGCGRSRGLGTGFAEAELTEFQVSVRNLWSFQEVMDFQNYCNPHVGVEE